MEKIVLVGAGWHCKVVADALKLGSSFEIAGLIDLVPENKKDRVAGLRVLGDSNALPELFKSGIRSAFVAVGSLSPADCDNRIEIYESLKKAGFSIPSVVHPSAIISGSVSLAEGVFVGPGAVINPDSTVGACAIINTRAVIEHDCSIGIFAHVAPGAAVCGCVSVGDRSHVGAGSVVKQHLAIGADCLIGAGGVVVKNVPDGVTAFGNPCRARSAPATKPRSPSRRD